MIARAAARRRQTDWLPLLTIGVAVVGSTVGGRFAADPHGLRIAAAGAAIALVAGLSFFAPRRVLFGLVVWLALLGLTRRLFSSVADVGGSDPLLLVGPVAIACLAAVAVGNGALEHRTSLSNAVLLFSGLVALSVLNPLQGGVTVGLAGLLFVLVPLLAFWIGRGLCDDATLERLLQLIAVIAVGAAAYGLFQVFRGFPSWDQRWIREVGSDYVALGVQTRRESGWTSTTRPFGTFSAASEYAYFIAIGLLAFAVLGLRLRWLAASGACAAVLVIATIYQSSRGIIVMLVVATALMLAASRGVRLIPALVASALAIVAIPAAVGQISHDRVGDQEHSTLILHQLQGLSDPFSEDSTLGAHISLLTTGIKSAAHDPLGVGVGAVTLAGSKFGGVARGREADPSNAAVALGIPGLLVFAAILGLALTRLYGLALQRRERLAYLALGVVALMTLQWLNGGQYAVAFLPWLILGWADRPVPRAVEEE